MQLSVLLTAFFFSFIVFLELRTDAVRQRIKGKIRIGYVGSRWGRILQKEVSRRKFANVEYKEVKVELTPRNLYSSILEVDNYMQNTSHDVILGDHSLSLMSVCGIYNIPYFDLDTNGGTIYDRLVRPQTLFSFPIPDEYYAKAVVAILKRYRVEKVAILIDETADYKGFLEPFFKQTTFYAKVWTIHSRAASNRLISSLDSTLRDLRANGFLDIVLKASLRMTRMVIDRAHYLAMIASPNKWYFPRVVCEDFGYTNLWHINTNFTFVNDFCNPSVDATFFDDQVLVMQSLDLLRTSGWSTDPQALKKVSQSPFTQNPFMSPVTFDQNGLRTNVTLQLHVPTEKGVMKIGIVLPSVKTGYFHSGDNGRLVLHSPLPPNVTEVIQPEKREIRVIGVVEHPHLIYSEENKTYTGFGVDLMNFLAKKLNFTYRLKIADHYGNYENGGWTGVMDDLLSGRADMTLGPLVQNREREDVIDFSTTFKQREISVVMRRPRQEPTFFQFARPFDIHVWGCVIASIIFMSFTLWLVELGSARANRRPTDFNLRESAWYIIATTVQGGTELVPRSLPGRILSGTLYFFVLILTTSYTANLAAFLTVKSFNLPINKVEDLPGQKKLKFGTVRDSSVLDFFADSDISAYREIYSQMHNINPTWLVNSSEDGFKRARKEDYAFIWDDSVNEYEVMIEDKNCELMVVGRPFGKRSFAIGLPQGSRLKEDIDKAILSLIDSAELANLEHKWWRAKSVCTNVGSSGKSRSLSLFDVAGVLLVLFCGCALALLALLAESFVIRVLCHRSRRSSSKDRQSSSSRHGTPGPAERDLMLTSHSLSRPVSNSNNGHDIGDGAVMSPGQEPRYVPGPKVNSSNSIREYAI